MRKTDQKRQHILDTACRVFQKHRFEKTTMSGIAAEAGGSKTTVYASSRPAPERKINDQ